MWRLDIGTHPCSDGDARWFDTVTRGSRDCVCAQARLLVHATFTLDTALMSARRVTLVRTFVHEDLADCVVSFKTGGSALLPVYTVCRQCGVPFKCALTHYSATLHTRPFIGLLYDQTRVRVGM